MTDSTEKTPIGRRCFWHTSMYDDKYTIWQAGTVVAVSDDSVDIKYDIRYWDFDFKVAKGIPKANVTFL